MEVNNLEILNKTLKAIEISDSDNYIKFTLKDGTEYLMYHAQDCCEEVYIESITGDIQDLIDSPLLMAQEIISTEEKETCNHFTYTFYNFATLKGYVTIRWIGNSNGYYSESVNFIKQ